MLKQNISGNNTELTQLQSRATVYGVSQLCDRHILLYDSCDHGHLSRLAAV